MRYAGVLSLLISLTFLTACEKPNECSWAEPIEFTKETKDWLAEQEWPQSAPSDFNKIGDHNELFSRFCN